MQLEAANYGSYEQRQYGSECGCQSARGCGAPMNGCRWWRLGSHIAVAADDSDGDGDDDDDDDDDDGGGELQIKTKGSGGEG